jgi:hypothetical protein
MIVSCIEIYLADSFWILRSAIVQDPIQMARLCLVSLAADDHHLVELIQPLGEGTPAFGALTRDQKLHHLCFGVSSCAVADALIDEYRLLPVTDWQPAVLFRGRLVRFAYTRHRELVEFVADGYSGG